MTRLLADYDLFRMIQDLPGSIAELGSFSERAFHLVQAPGDVRARRSLRARSMASRAAEAIATSRPKTATQPMDRERRRPQVVPDGYLERMVKLTNQDNLLPGVERCRVISAISWRRPGLCQCNQGTRLSMIFMDVNLYKRRSRAFVNCIPCCSRRRRRHDGYGSPPWLGETAAFENYFKEIGSPCRGSANFPIRSGPAAISSRNSAFAVVGAATISEDAVEDTSVVDSGHIADMQNRRNDRNGT